MSEQEEHEIIGRTVLEHGEARRKLAALEAKARDYSALLTEIRETRAKVEELAASLLDMGVRP